MIHKGKSKLISLIRPQTLKTASWIGVSCPSEFALSDMMVQTIHWFQKYKLNSPEFALLTFCSLVTEATVCI